MIKLVILGAPGSGKGAQTYRVAQKFNLKLVVVGDVVKQEIRDKTELGKIMYEYTSVGKFVPSDIVVKVLENQVKNLEGFDGYIIDTAPINMDQKTAMVDFPIDGAIWLKVENYDVLRERVLDRLICPKCKKVTSKTECPDRVCPYCGAVLEQRYDDNLETLNKRLEGYEKSTLPVVESYKQEGKLIEINAEQSKEQVFEEICEKVSSFLQKGL